MADSVALKLFSSQEIVRQVAERARALRLRRNLTQQGLAARSGVSLATLKLFERTGRISFASLVQIAFALDAEKGLDELFVAEAPRTIEDVVDKPGRARGRCA